MAMTHPEALHESPLLAGYRFLLELAAWVAIYFAWSWIALVLAVAALSLFSVPGDKHLVLVRIPGPMRILLEAGVGAAGIAAAGRVGGSPAALLLAAAYLALFGLSWRRLAWMWGR
ncbi:MAG: hypothetical protein HY561_11115 [Gemmatimonadetes bacterium]|nr:hypothetical protein [Gemmatimonadota bacterium]